VLPSSKQPLPEEIETAALFLERTRFLEKIKSSFRWQIAFTQTLKSLRFKGFEIPPYRLAMEKSIPPNGQTIMTTYHPKPAKHADR